MVEQNVMYSLKNIILSYRKEQNADRSDNVGEPGERASCKKPDASTARCVIPRLREVQNRQIHRDEIDCLGMRGRESGGSDCLTGLGSFLGW